MPVSTGRIKIILAPCGVKQRSRSVVEMDITLILRPSADTITSDCEIIVDLIDGSGGKEVMSWHRLPHRDSGTTLGWSEGT